MDRPAREVPRSSSDSLRLRLEAPAQVIVGEPVPIALRVENVSERPLTLYLTGRSIAFDIIVEAVDGTLVWRRLEGEVIQSVLRLQTVNPAEALVLEEVWDQRTRSGYPVAPGEYRVRAELFTEQGSLAPPHQHLRILSR